MKNVNQPLVSIITVVYNGEKYLEQTIKSVINQTYNNIEYIIIDGGSTDGTHSIIEKYKHNITCFVSEPDKGLYDAMNKGIAIANGELIGMINSDDWYELNTVELMVQSFNQNPKKRIFHADRFDIDDKGHRTIKRFNKSTFKFKYWGMTYSHPSMFITKNEYLSHRYNTNLRSLSDYQFVLEALLKNKDTFHYVNMPLVNYRVDGISAQLPLIVSLKEGFIARRLAGMTFVNNLFSFCFRFLMNLYSKMRAMVKNVLTSKR